MRILLLAFLCVSAQAQDTRPWTIDDIVEQESARSWTLSRDGRFALWVRSRADSEKDGSRSALMLLDMATGKSRPLTVGRVSIGSPAFSPSARYVSWTSSADFPDGEKGPGKDEKGAQVWALDLEGGMARPLTAIPFGVGSYQWIDDDTLLLTARERRGPREREAHEAKDKTRPVEDPHRFVEARRRLHRYTIDSKKLVRLTSDDLPMQQFVASDDGRWAVALLGVSPKNGAENNAPPRVMLYDLSTAPAAATELYGDRKNRPSSFHWTADSQAFFALRPHSTVDGEATAAVRYADLVQLDEGNGRPRIEPVELRWEPGISGSFQVTRTGGFVTGVCNGVRPEFRRYECDPKDGNWTHQKLTGPNAERMVGIVLARASDRILYIHGGASDPDHVVAATLDGDEVFDPKEVCRPNKGFEHLTIAATEVRRWQGAGGDTIEGILYHPHPGSTHGDGPHPLVLITHGGPHAADRDRFSERWANSPNLYCQRGAYVLKTNYHGSSDYGLAFGESIKGRYYELEVVDMFAGIQMLVDAGLADPDRLGLVGWSNGAILSIAALTHGDRYAPEYSFSFRACAPGAGDVNWTSDYGNCAFGARFDEFYIGGTPWEDSERYLEKSPLFHLAKVTTPTIIFFGTEDTAVPTQQGWEHYRAMSRIGRAPVRFLLFPGEPHGLRKLSHQRRKLREELEWFDRHLFDRAEARDIVADEAPLTVAHALRGGRTAEGLVGRRRNGVLFPETVRWKPGLEVGRFEVTRAQWAAFEGGGSDPGPHANLPATGVTAEQAVAYARWLSTRTGETWRLPTADEFVELEKHKGKTPNILTHWAGFEPAPEEVEELQAMVLDLGAAALRPAGASAPGWLGHGEAKVAVFDLGGNAAEWVEAADGVELRGACAVTFDDGRSQVAPPPAELGGIRLIVER